MRLASFEYSARVGRNGPDGPWSEALLDTILDSVRKEVDWPVRPPIVPSYWDSSNERAAQRAPGMFKIAMRDPLPEDADAAHEPFVWYYYDLEVPWVDPERVARASFPLAIAQVKDPKEGGQRHLFTIHSLFKLLPQGMEAATLLNPGHRDDWNYFQSLGMTYENDVVPSNHAWTWQKKKDPNLEPHPSGLSFNYYMGNSRALLGTLAYLLKNPHAKERMQDACLAILRSVCGLCGNIDLLPDLAVAQGTIAGNSCKGLLQDILLPGGGQTAMDLWNQRHYVNMPSLDGNDRVDRVDLALLVFFAFRFSEKCQSLRALSKVLVVHVANAVDLLLPTALHRNIPPYKLPAECNVAAVSIRKALRGDDKRAQMLATPCFFLKKNLGAGYEAEDYLLKNFVYGRAFRSYVHFAANAFCGAYLRKARFTYRELVARQTRIMADAVMADCSRCAKKELCLVHIASHGYLCTAPLQILSDQPKAQEAKKAVERASLILTQGTTGRAKAPKVELESTRTYAIAVTHSLLAVLPFTNCKVYKPASLVFPGPGWQRHWSNVHKQWYFWDPASHSACWVLSDELRLKQFSSVRILVLVADEGSQGWAWYQYMSNHLRWRVLFIRDPLHRLSNLFVNGMKSNVRCLESALLSVTIAKFRRGPYGSGKFWSELKTSLQMFLRFADFNHPIVERFAKDIAADHGKQLGGLNWNALKSLMEDMLQTILGPATQMRRWWSVFDSCDHMMRNWHTMLMGLMVQLAMDGQDPWKILCTAAPVIVKEDDRVSKTFKYKHQVLLALFDKMTYYLNHSMLIVYRRIRVHHAQITDSATNPKAGLQTLQLWADYKRWIQLMVAPTCADALKSVDAWRRLGIITATVTSQPAPLLDSALSKVGSCPYPPKRWARTGHPTPLGGLGFRPALSRTTTAHGPAPLAGPPLRPGLLQVTGGPTRRRASACPPRAPDAICHTSDAAVDGADTFVALVLVHDRGQLMRGGAAGHKASRGLQL